MQIIAMFVAQNTGVYQTQSMIDVSKSLNSRQSTLFVATTRTFQTEVELKVCAGGRQRV